MGIFLDRSGKNRLITTLQRLFQGRPRGLDLDLFEISVWPHLPHSRGVFVSEKGSDVISV
jgi:hypothetical protein